MPISPWDYFVQMDSPNGHFAAIYDDAMEIAMGAPTRGVLKISEKQSGRCIVQVTNANASFVWSSDSAALAVPQWTPKRMQQLLIVSIPHGTIKPINGNYRVLQLASFHEGMVAGVDSPIHRPTKIAVKAA